MIGGHIPGKNKQSKIQSIAHDMWAWEPKNCGESMDGWKLVTKNVWGCEDNPGRDGKSDFRIEVRDGKVWTFGGDRERFLPWPMDNDVWVAELPD